MNIWCQDISNNTSCKTDICILEIEVTLISFSKHKRINDAPALITSLLKDATVDPRYLDFGYLE